MPAEIKISILFEGNGKPAEEAAKTVEDLGKTAKDAGKGFSVLSEIGISALRELGAAATNAALGGLKALGGAVMDGIADAREAAKINAQTAQVIKSTGQAAGVSAEHVADYAASLSAAAGQSLFGDSQIQESTNLLLTFTNIKGTVLDAATAISVDMAQALGGAPKDAAIQLGKALNDPVKGVTALTRVGVTFSQEQKDMIQALVDTGDVAGAQAVILEELNKEFGGSAAAAAAADGGWAQFNDRLGEAKETIGAAILPLLNTLVSFMNDSLMPMIETAATAFSAWLANPQTQAGIAQLTSAIQTGLGVALTFITETAIPALIAGWQAIQPAIQALLPIVASIINSFKSAGDSTSALGGVLQDVGVIWTQYRALIEAELAAIWAIIQAVFTQIMIFWQAHGTEIMAFVQMTWDTIVQIITLALELLQATIIPTLQNIAVFISTHSAEIQSVLTIAWEAIRSIVTAALAIIKGIIQTALALVRGDWQGAWDAIKGIAVAAWAALQALFKLQLDLIYLIWGDTWNKVKVFFQGIMDGIVGWVLQTLQGIVNALNSFAGTAKSAAGSIGSAIVNGITSGIESGASAIINAAKDAAMDALNAAKSALGIGSPSKVFAKQIGLPMAQGMAVGLAGGAPMVADAANYTAGAGVAGASSVANTYRTLNYSPVYNTNAAPQEVDAALLGSLAGV